MLRRPPIFPLTDTLFPYPTLFRSARPLFHRTDLSGADAPGERSGAAFPVHPQYRLLARLRSQATLRRRADTRAADGAFDPAALRPAAGRRGALRARRVPHPPPHFHAVPRLRHARRRRLPHTSRPRYRAGARARAPRPILPHPHTAPPARPRPR